MILRSNKKWVYESPEVKQTGLWLEALICQSARFHVQVDEIKNINEKNEASEPLYFEF